MLYPTSFPTRVCQLVVLLLAAVPLTAGATSFERLSVERMTLLSSHAVTARCMELESRWNEDRTTILTRAEFEVERTLHGDLSRQRISVILPGGTVGDDSVLVIGAPEIEVGDQMVLMLQQVAPQTAEIPFEAAGPMFSVVGLSQGVFEVQRDPATDRMRAVSAAMPIFSQQEAADEAALPPGGAEGMVLSELEERIRAASRLEARTREGQEDGEVELGEGADGQTPEEDAPQPPQTTPQGFQDTSDDGLEGQEEEGAEETGAGPGDAPEPAPEPGSDDDGEDTEVAAAGAQLQESEEPSERSREAQETEGQEETGAGSGDEAGDDQ